MSKRTMILLGVAFICVIAAFFLQKHELTEPEPEEVETEPEEEEEETENNLTNVQEEATTTETGTAKPE
jgi:flagellar basal body-associated protein FliL